MTLPKPSEDFFSALQRFSSFSELVDESHYRPVPSDWTVFVADIRGSTDAIAQGRYKDVNTIGAACITAARNATRRDLACVFGGDGASFVVPPDLHAGVANALLATANLASVRFGLTLRVGAIGVAELTQGDTRLELARYELASGRCIALFRGGGLGLADRRIKDPESRYLLNPSGGALRADLKGLSCRWQAIPNRRGVVLSVLVESRPPDNTEIYCRLVDTLDSIFDGKLAAANPVAMGAMSYKSVRQCLSDERRYHKSVWSLAFLGRAAEIVAAVGIYKYGINPLGQKAWRYADAMAPHADFHKFDDMFRMVVDCTHAQAKALRDALESGHASGEVFFGIHEADAALMTCVVESLDDGGHIHFIDGADGGYTLAAAALKEQRRAAM